MFDAPDYDLYRELELPTVAEVQLLSAFAHDLEAFAEEEAYSASRAGQTWAAEAFVPLGLFEPGGEAIDPPRAYAIFLDHMFSTALLTNPAMGAQFYWAMVCTLGGEMDVVADRKLLTGTLTEGGVVYGLY